MITDADIKKLSKVFATKEDLNGFVTKEDLKGLATKEDIQELKTRLDTLEDNVTGDIAKLQDENLVTSNYRRDLDNHEERISAVEAKLATVS